MTLLRQRMLEELQRRNYSQAAYPILNQLGTNPSPEGLRRAVERERTRLLPGPAPKPRSASGRSVQEWTDAPTVVIERVQQRAEAGGPTQAKGKKSKRPGRRP